MYVYVYVPDRTRQRLAMDHNPSNTKKAGRNDVRLQTSSPPVTESARHPRSNTTLRTSRDTVPPRLPQATQSHKSASPQPRPRAKQNTVLWSPVRARVSRLTGGEGRMLCLPCVTLCTSSPCRPSKLSIVELLPDADWRRCSFQKVLPAGSCAAETTGTPELWGTLWIPGRGARGLGREPR